MLRFPLQIERPPRKSVKGLYVLMGIVTFLLWMFVFVYGFWELTK